MKSKLSLAFAFWILFIILDFFKKSIWERDESLIFYFYLPGLVLWLILTIPMISLSDVVFNRTKAYGILVIGLSGLVIGFGKTILTLSIQWFMVYSNESIWWEFISTTRPLFFIENVIIVWVFIGFMLIFAFYKRYVDQTKLAAELESELSKAQLQSLRMQLEPHFLFNTLNTITALVRGDKKEEALDTLNGFSSLLRNVLNDKRPMVQLATEIFLVQQYLKIEAIRFKDRLQVTYDLTPDSLDIMVPELILQPIAENAIKHGISRFIGKGVINVSSVVEESVLKIKVFNSSPAIVDVSTTKSGIGLDNVRKRIANIYGRSGSLIISSEHNGVLVTLEFPLNHE